MAASSRLLPVLLLAAAGVVVSPGKALAERFTRDQEVTWESVRRETRAFFSNVVLGGFDEDGDGNLSANERLNAGVLRSSAAASLLVGVTCGLLGGFIILRRMALFGDMLGHAVLPGVAVGFILAGSKSTTALLFGALGAGLLAAAITRVIRSWSRVKEDAALGITLSLFYAIGIWLLSWITRHPDLSAEASGLDRYLFGNPAVINAPDLVALGVGAALVLAVIGLGFKEFLVCAFDRGFAASIGLPGERFDAVLLVLLTTVIVVSVKVLGIILVAALLVIPPATAYLLTERFLRLCALSCVLGAVAGLGGVYASAVLYIGTGPAIVCLAFGMLIAAFVASPTHGVLGRYVRHRRLALRTVRENILGAAWRVVEREGRPGPGGLEVPLAKIAAERDEPLAATRALAKRLRGSGWGDIEDDRLVLTAAGEERARRVIRIHRLWELFLSQEASLPADHVHPGAEEIEHTLDEDAIEELEKVLGHPTRDPHGREIPKGGPPEALRGGSRKPKEARP